jgi:hypothetical protein
MSMSEKSVNFYETTWHNIPEYLQFSVFLHLLYLYTWKERGTIYHLDLGHTSIIYLQQVYNSHFVTDIQTWE